MTFHTLAYAGSISPGGLENVPAVQDGVYAVRNNAFVQGNDSMALAAYAMSANLLQARLSTASLKPIAEPLIRPLNIATAVPNDPNLAELLDNPIRLKATEEIVVEAGQGGGGAENAYVFLWVTPGLTRPPDGEIITIRGESSDTSTANEWTEVSLDWDVKLKRGRYAVVGSECVSENGLAHRWIFDDQGPRPGGLSMESDGNRTHEYFYRGRLGTWGAFNSAVMPRLEVFCSAAGSSHVPYLQVVPLGE